MHPLWAVEKPYTDKVLLSILTLKYSDQKTTVIKKNI